MLTSSVPGQVPVSDYHQRLRRASSAVNNSTPATMANMNTMICQCPVNMPPISDEQGVKPGQPIVMGFSLLANYRGQCQWLTSTPARVQGMSTTAP